MKAISAFDRPQHHTLWHNPCTTLSSIMGIYLSSSQEERDKTTRYAMPLRAIGQALEALRVEAFNLEKEGDDYRVRGWTKALPRKRLPSGSVPDGDVPMDMEGLSSRFSPGEEISDMRPSSSEVELSFAPEDIVRLEREGQERRSNPHEMPSGRSKSELLRAAGDYVDQRDARLLGISWRDQSISIVYETVEGHRELDVFSLSSMYDYWQVMCLRREAAASQMAARA